MAALKRSIVKDADCTAEDSGSDAKRLKTVSDDLPINTNDFGDQRSWISVELGAGSWTIGHRFTVEYITTATVPCLKFTSITGSVPADWPCRVHKAASPGRFVDVLCMPVRCVLDLLHLALTGNRELVKDRGYNSVLPHPNTPADDNSFYNLVALGAVLNGMIVPGSSTVPRCVSGMWSVYKQPRGPLFIACDELVDWEGDDTEQDQEQQAPEPQSAQDSGVESCTEDDTVVESAEDRSDMEYDEDTAEDDSDEDTAEDYSDEENVGDGDLVFPLCHICQLPSLLSVINLWLETRKYEERGLLVDCKVPERVTLVPIPTQEDDYEYTGLNYCIHWPSLKEYEIENMNTVVCNV